MLSREPPALAITAFDRWSKPFFSSHKKSRPAIPSRDGGGSASRLDVLKPLASCGPRKDWDDVTGYTVDMTISGFVPSHHEPSEALVRIVDQIHQPLHFP